MLGRPRLRRLVLLSLSALLACEGPSGPTGPEGPAGPGTPPSVSGVSPRSVFLEHPVDVTISGSGTTWGSGTTVDFGSDVQVADLIVASPTALVASILPSRSAALGPRTVTVSDDDSQASFTDGFEVQAPLEIRSVTGTVAQGSILFVDLVQRDPSAPFDARSTGTSFESLRFPNLDVALEGQSRSATVTAATEFSLRATVSLDVTSSTGSADLIVESGPDGGVVPSALPGALTVNARSPTEVAPGSSRTVPVVDSLESLLFSTTAPPGELVRRVTSVSSGEADPQLFHLPESGEFSDVITGEPPLQHQFVAGASSVTHHQVYLDPGGASGYDVTVSADAFPTSAESEPNDDSGSANPLSGGIVASVGSVGDEDYFEVNALAGQTITVSSGSGVDTRCPEVDPELEILDTDGTSTLAFEDGLACDVVSTTVPADGTYFVRVSASSDFCPDCTFGYSLLIRVQ